ncbi:hypothetical protein [Algoriphagus boritolerans]|uniref:hypothetical protein n=1 Tax=Algoriphagus boritolerans TaxID=308111 RepID=UPI002FCDE4FF
MIRNSLNYRKSQHRRSREAYIFFLSGPNNITFSENGIQYSHHLFTDSLNFLVGKNQNPRRILKLQASTIPTDPDQIWYQLTAYKEEKTNILNSGRNWFSAPIRQGQSLNINLRLNSETFTPWIFHGKLMAQSSSASTMSVLSGNDLLEEIPFSSIPNSTYGIKGREAYFDFEFNPSSNSLPQVRFTFQGTGTESAGFLDYFVVGVPYSNPNLREGIVEGKTRGVLSFPSDYTSGKSVISLILWPLIPRSDQMHWVKNGLFFLRRERLKSRNSRLLI